MVSPLKTRKFSGVTFHLYKDCSAGTTYSYQAERNAHKLKEKLKPFFHVRIAHGWFVYTRGRG